MQKKSIQHMPCLQKSVYQQKAKMPTQKGSNGKSSFQDKQIWQN